MRSARGALVRAAKTIGKSLRRCGRLNRAKDQPIPEQNLVLHLAAALLGKGYAVYGEADLPKAGRIDLLACTNKTGLIVEAATFGSINMAKLLRDAQRLEKYQPQCRWWKLKSKRRATEFWACLDEHWAMIVVLCFSRDHLAECWRRLLDEDRLEEALAAPEVKEIRAFKAGRREAMRDFGRFLRKRETQLGVVPVFRDSQVWLGVGPLWLLSASWPLDR